MNLWRESLQVLYAYKYFFQLEAINPATLELGLDIFLNAGIF
jgi:hypothetical protein